MDLKDNLHLLSKEAVEKIEAASDLKELDQVRVAYLGKKGPITEISKGMKTVSAEERPILGALVNEVRNEITSQLEAKKARLEMGKNQP